MLKLAAANSGSDTISLSEDITLRAPLPPIRDEITIEGNGHTIDGDGKYRIFDVVGGKLTLKNLTLTNGKAPADQYGGAILLRNGGEVSVEDASFTNNAARWGGAIMTEGLNARLTINKSSFTGNRAEQFGGVIYAIGTVAISNSSFTDNGSYDSGGVLVASTGKIHVSNSTFHNNWATYNAGAVFVFTAEVTLTHVTMVNNLMVHGYGYGGGTIYKQATDGTEGAVNLRNSIIVGNPAFPACAGGLDQSIGNLSPDGTCNIRPSDDPLLDDPTGSPAYFTLRDYNPAVDAADAEYCLETDQIGTARPQGGGCDIGAIESTTARPAELPIVPPPPCPLSDQIIAANTDAPAGGCPAGSGHDTIVFYRDIVLSAPLPSLTSQITIEGNGYTISGDRRFRIFDVDGGRLTVNHLTLTEGDASGNFGGAIRLQNGGQAIANDSTFIGNSAESGGAIGSMFEVSMTINSSKFVSNQAEIHGGAINLNGGGRATITNSSFLKNSVGINGGIGGAIDASFAGRVDISNSTFIGNIANRGGALAVEYAPVTATHVTMLNNRAGWGSGIYKEEGGSGAVRLRNSILAGGGRSNCFGRLAQNVSNLIEDGSCSAKLSGDPMFEDEGDSPVYLALQAGSPAIDAANSDLCLETDQIGTPRPLGGGCDIGAIEAVPPVRILSDCHVTTTHGLNFRDGPQGNRIGIVSQNMTLVASARTPNWFNVEHDGISGWISAEYVVTQGDCE